MTEFDSHVIYYSFSLVFVFASTDSLDLLITLGEDPNVAQSEGLTPLHVASGEGHEG